MLHYGPKLVTMYAFGLNGRLIDTSTVYDDVPNEMLSISSRAINKVIVHFNQGSTGDFDTYDNIYFDTPVPEPITIFTFALGGLTLLKKQRK